MQTVYGLNAKLFEEVTQLAVWVDALEARGIRVLALRLPARCRYFWPDVPLTMRCEFLGKPVSFLDRER